MGIEVGRMLFAAENLTIVGQSIPRGGYSCALTHIDTCCAGK